MPSRSAIYRSLVRQGLIEPKARRRRREDYKRWERSRAMELWQMDVVGRIFLSDGTSISAVTGIDDHSRFCVIAHLVPRATSRPVCDALLEGLARHGIPESILTDNGRVFTAKLLQKQTNVLFDRICHNNGIRHILTAPYSPTTTGKVERLHRTMRREFFDHARYETIEETQAALDAWVYRYNTEREHQSIGDMTPITRFALAPQRRLEVMDGDIVKEPPAPQRRTIKRIVDSGGRVRVLAFRYHVGRQLAGLSVEVASDGGLLHFSHNGVQVATHAKRHTAENDANFEGRPRAVRPSKPTTGTEVTRTVDTTGSISFAATGYRVGNQFKGREAGVRLVGDTVQITIDGRLIRTHRARHDKAKEYGALAQPNGKPRRKQDGVA